MAPRVPVQVVLDFASGAKAWVEPGEGPAQLTLVTRRGDDGTYPRSMLAFALDACAKGLLERPEIERVNVGLAGSGIVLGLRAAPEHSFEDLWRALHETFPACASPAAMTEERDTEARRWARRDTLNAFGTLAIAELQGETIALDAYATAEVTRLSTLDVSAGRAMLEERFSPDDLLLLARTSSDVDAALRPVLDTWRASPRPAPAREHDEARVGRAVLRYEHSAIRGELQVILFARAPERHHPDRMAYELAVEAFGGATSSHLFAELRETEGLTYGSGARLIDVPRSVMRAVVSFEPDEAVENTRLFLRLFTEAHAVHARDLETAVRRRWARARQALASGDPGPLASAWIRGLTTPEAVQEAWLAEADVTPEEATQVASTWFDARRALLVLLGNPGALGRAAVVREGAHFVLREAPSPEEEALLAQ
ncbi:MAG: insulinase family protein [Myxococcales bacterium]|nr:insulinase family protein [Myxococcales bacterium]